MKAEIKPYTLRDLSFTLSNARLIDKQEVLAAGPRSLTEAAWITDHVTRSVGGAGFTVWIDGNPEVSFGFTMQSELTPWLFSGWAWGSEKIDVAMPAIGAWAKDHLLRLLDDLGARRIEARSIVEHKHAHRWLEWMGFTCEGALISFGRNGEDYFLYSWVQSVFLEHNHRGLAAHAVQTLTE